MPVLQPLADSIDLLRSEPVVLSLAAIALFLSFACYFLERNLWLSLGLAVSGIIGAAVLIALCHIIWSSVIEGLYGFGAIFASVATFDAASCGSDDCMDAS